jgi:DNA-cytosine methyltransferase
MSKKQLTAVTLCSGGGIGTAGLHKAGVKDLLAVDNWEVAKKVFEHNFPDSIFLQKSIDELGPNEIIEAINLEPGELDFVLSSPPCQPWSGLNRHPDPLDSRIQTFFNCITQSRILKPKVVLFENVKGMTDKRHVTAFNELKLRIQEELGGNYHLRSFILNSLNYQVPQIRQRLFIVGYLKEFGVIPTPPPANLEGIDKLKINKVAPHIESIRIPSHNIVKLGSSFMNTLTASEKMKVLSNGSERNFTEDEMKIFMTVPDQFQFPEGISFTNKVKIIGNGIPSNLIYHVINHIKQELFGDQRA